MDWDTRTQTGARTSGVEEPTPRMAMHHRVHRPDTERGTIIDEATECMKGRRKPTCCSGHAWCWLNLRDTREGAT